MRRLVLLATVLMLVPAATARCPHDDPCVVPVHIEPGGRMWSMDPDGRQINATVGDWIILHAFNHDEVVHRLVSDRLALNLEVPNGVAAGVKSRPLELAEVGTAIIETRGTDYILIVHVAPNGGKPGGPQPPSSDGGEEERDVPAVPAPLLLLPWLAVARRRT